MKWHTEMWCNEIANAIMYLNCNLTLHPFTGSTKLEDEYSDFEFLRHTKFGVIIKAKYVHDNCYYAIKIYKIER